MSFLLPMIKESSDMIHLFKVISSNFLFTSVRDHVKIPREGKLDKPKGPAGKRLLLPREIERGKTQAKYQKTLQKFIVVSCNHAVWKMKI